jgi:hypothetical protein
MKRTLHHRPSTPPSSKRCKQLSVMNQILQIDSIFKSMERFCMSNPYSPSCLSNKAILSDKFKLLFDKDVNYTVFLGSNVMVGSYNCIYQTGEKQLVICNCHDEIILLLLFESPQKVTVSLPDDKVVVQGDLIAIDDELQTTTNNDQLLNDDMATIGIETTDGTLVVHRQLALKIPLIEAMLRNSERIPVENTSGNIVLDIDQTTLSTMFKIVESNSVQAALTPLYFSFHDLCPNFASVIKHKYYYCQVNYLIIENDIVTEVSTTTVHKYKLTALNLSTLLVGDELISNIKIGVRAKFTYKGKDYYAIDECTQIPSIFASSSYA